MDGLRWIEELVNTRSLEFDTDDIADPYALTAWFRERGLLAHADSVSGEALRKAVILREGLRALIGRNCRAGDDGRDPATGVDAAALGDLAALAATLPLAVDVDADPPRLAPVSADPVEAALARILAGVAAAVADGTWFRMKVCRQPDCRWAYYDESRNRSRTWCSMESCGNRAKARSFRQRHR